MRVLHDHEREVADLGAAQGGQVHAVHAAFVRRTHALDELGVGQQLAQGQPVDQVVHQRLDLHEHQGVKVGEQTVHRAHAVGGGHDGNGVVLFGQGHAAGGAGGSKGVHTCNHRHVNARIQRLHGAGQVAKGGVGAGVALHQKQHVLPRQQPGQHRLCGAHPGAGQLVAVVRHGEQQRLVLCGRRKPGTLHDVKRIAGRFGAARGVSPHGIGALQLRPRCAGNEARVAGAEGDADEAAQCRGILKHGLAHAASPCAVCTADAAGIALPSPRCAHTIHTGFSAAMRCMCKMGLLRAACSCSTSHTAP